MDLTTYVRDNSLFPLLLSSTLFFLFLIAMQIKLFSSKNIKKLPPGPPQLPIIGNLHQAGDKPHVSIADISKKYGPLISLRFGQQLVVVASSPETAIAVLKTQDRFLSSRVVPTTMKQPSLLPHSLMWSECNQTWKNLRQLCRVELFSAKALEAQSRLREEKIAQMLEFLRRTQGEVIDIEDVVFTTLFNTLSSIILGKDLLEMKVGHGTPHGLKESLRKLIDYGGRTINLGSFFPVLERFDLHGMKKGTMKLFDKIFPYWEDIIEERRSIVNSSSWSSEQAQSFLDLLIENGFSNNQINQLITELFVAGTNTTTSTLIWAMSEIVRHKEVFLKIEREIKNEINSHQITTNQVSKLTYLQACIKESFRMHPPVPLLLRHKAVETCEVMNYIIPKDATIYVNVWAMGRDPKIWDDPLSFKPERFIESTLDFKGQHFELLPFGSGRRMCPGLPSGVRSFEYILASLIREFDWGLPDGDDPLNLNMNEKFGIAMKREKPLKLIFKQKEA